VSKFRFKPEDFQGSIRYEMISPHFTAIRANELLDKAIAEAPVVYCVSGGVWTASKYSADTHKAVLFNIEEIVKKDCEHEPIMHAFNANAVLPSSKVETKCRHCGITLKARWEAAE
jgi:hypothetical protein